MNLVTDTLNKGLAFDAVYLDSEKRFDRVPHKRLLLNLRDIGIHGTLLKWCESFLSQRVFMGEFIVGWKDIISGVPQGFRSGSNIFHHFY